MDLKNKIRVRFAPSPTGYLHIGSARTALFNWLFAKKTGGRFILRIEDTDILRHMESTIDLITESLKWLGMSWDEGPDIGGDFGPYRQSHRTDIYKKYADKLINVKKAYPCFCTPETLEEKRLKKSSSGEFFVYDRECLRLPDEQIKQNLKDKIPYAVRLSVPEEQEIRFTDRVYGNIKVNSNTIEDFIIIRSNGLPTYNFSAAVDDMLMEITHVIRGEDHLSNTPKQILVYKAFKKEHPDFTHLPMIHGADGQKLSKRHGSISIESYREEGFLPEAIVNYLALLGWAYDEKTTIFSVEELISRFSLEAINKRPAKFDYEKLVWLNGNYIRNREDKDIESLVYERLEKKGTDKKQRYDMIPKIIPLIKERMKTLSDADNTVLQFYGDVEYTEEIKDYFIGNKETAINVLDNAIPALEELKDFDRQNIENKLRKISEDLEITFRKVAEVIRIAIWASSVSPPLFGTMEILGKDVSLNRLKAYREII